MKTTLCAVCLVAAIPMWAQMTDWAKENLHASVKTITHYSALDDGMSSRTHTIQYDKQGFIQEEIVYNLHGEKTSSTRYEYDAAHRLTKQQIFNRADQLTEETVFELDNNGWRTAKKVFKVEGGVRNLSRVVQYTNDARGNCIEEIEFTGKQTRLATNRYEYNAANKITKLSVVVGHVDFFYNAAMQLDSTRFYDDEGALNAIKIFKYNEHGNQASLFDYQADSAVPTHIEHSTYEYDEFNNWTACKTTYATGKMRYQRRELVYYTNK